MAYVPVEPRYPNRELLIRHLESMISIYFGNQNWQRNQTLGAFLADDLLETHPDHMALMLKDNDAKD